MKFKITKWVLSLLLFICGMSAYAQTPTTDLSTHEPTVVPSDATFEWRTGAMPSSPLVANPAAVPPGLYYGFYNFGDDCFSEGTPISIITNACPTETVDLNSAVDTPTGEESFHSALPVSDANEITGTAITAAAAGATYYVAYKTTVDGSSCYSEARPIVVVATGCCDIIVAASGTATICTGSSASLEAIAVGGDGNYTYAWSWSNGLGNGDSLTVSPISNTTYTVTVTDGNNCTATEQVLVTVNTTPTVNAGDDGDLCRFFSTNLSASATGGTAPYDYSWSHAPGTGNNKTVTPLNTTTYIVTVTSNNGCNDTDEITVTVNDCYEICGNGDDDDGNGQADCADSACGPTVDLGTDQNNCISTDITLTAEASGGNGTLIYSWSHSLGSGNSKTVAPATSTVYSVTVTAPSGCTATDQVTVNVVPCSENCYNNIDDDGDDLIDCDDPDCLAVASPVLVDDYYTTCPGMPYSNRVTYNDGNLQNPAFSIVAQPSFGMVNIDATGKFVYTPNGLDCTTDNFIYQVCNQLSGCCATATVDITLGDNTFPVLTNVPADLTIGCDDLVPGVELVTGFDECPGLYIDYQETSDQHYLGACESYTITRTWTATDFCGNTSSQSQKITVMDMTKPEIFQVYTLENGKKVIAGISQRVSKHWKYVPFPITFHSSPVILTQVITNHDIAAITTQQRNSSLQGFELRVAEEEASTGDHSAESVAWMAIEPGAFDGNMKFEAGTFANANDSLQTVNFAQSFGSMPLFFSSIMTSKEADPSVVRLGLLDGSSATLHLQEETSADAEVHCKNETLGYIAMENETQLKDRSNDIFGEAGNMNLANAWTTVNLARKYTKPVVICGGLTKHDDDPVGIRVRNVTSTSFEVRLQEWDYLDGNHGSENISWMVMEGSIPGNQGYYCAGAANRLQPYVNVFAMDNCDDLTSFGYQETQDQATNGMLTTRTWMAIDDCGNTTLISRYDTCVVAAVKVKTILNGATISAAGGLMRDNLRSTNLLPIEEPYSTLNSFSHVEYQHDEAPVQATMVTVCVDDDGTPTTIEIPAYLLQSYLNSGAYVGSCVANPSGMVTICHKPGTPAQKTKTIPQSALMGHLNHGDVIGPCSGSGNDLAQGAVNAEYKSTADGIWSDASTWEGGSIPPLTSISNTSIAIRHNVTILNSSLKLKNNSQLYVTYGSLTMKNGKFDIEKSAAYFKHAVFDGSTAGEFKLWEDESRLYVEDCVFKVGQHLKTEKGEIYMKDVCLDVSEDLFNHGIDTLINVCAVIHGKVHNHHAGGMYAQNVKFRLPNGDFENKANTPLNGGNLTILIESGKLINEGDWTAPISQYCVAGAVTGLGGSLLGAQDCMNIADLFNPCEYEEEEVEETGGNSPPTITNEEVINAGNSSGDGEMDPVLLTVTGTDAIVDWLLVELRDAEDEEEIVGYATVGLQRDGDVITEDGDDMIIFPGLNEGDYYVSVRHRNHLGMMTDEPVYLSTDNAPLLDFSDPALKVRDEATAGKISNGKRVMWSGDFNEDGRIIYQGPYNDVFFLFSRVLSDPSNDQYLANYIINDYDLNDLNLDGKVIYQGPNNDRAPLLYHAILAHPNNGAFLANFIVSGTMP